MNSKREEVIEVLRKNMSAIGDYPPSHPLVNRVADALLERFCMCEHDWYHFKYSDPPYWYCEKCDKVRAREEGK